MHREISVGQLKFEVNGSGFEGYPKRFEAVVKSVRSALVELPPPTLKYFHSCRSFKDVPPAHELQDEVLAVLLPRAVDRALQDRSLQANIWVWLTAISSDKPKAS